MGKEVKTFYRYLRPQRFNEKRIELTTLPHGGICLRFEELPDGDLFFTYSRCHPQDLFNKDVARVIADDRASAAKSDVRIISCLRALPNVQNTDLLVNSVVRRCRLINVELQHQIVQKYMQHEYCGFANVLEQLQESNRIEQLRCEAWKKGIQHIALPIYRSYNK